MGLFRNKPFLDEEISDWIIESYGWLMKNFGGRELMKETPLIEATEEFFSIKTEEKNHKQAKELFACVQKHTQMDKWKCTLKEGETPREHLVAPTTVLEHQGESVPAGTFKAARKNKGAVPVITYDPKLLNQPQNLIATFAHELGHYLTFNAKTAPPGGWELCEPLADLAAIYLGFGTFTLNTQFQFSQHQGVMSQGWQSQQAGYLTEDEGLFALAIFAELTATPDEAVSRNLKPSLVKTYKQARKSINEDFVDRLRALP